MVDFNRIKQGAHSATLDFSKAQTIETGQRIDFSKENPTVTAIRAELHWTSNHDADASVMILGGDSKALKGLTTPSNPNSTKGMVWYNNLENPGVKHSGDARTSDGDPSAPEETITMRLNELDAQAEAVVVVASTFPEDDAGNGAAVPFGKIHDCRVDVIDDANNTVLYQYWLSENFSVDTSVELLKLYKFQGTWKLTSMGEGCGKEAVGLQNLATKYGLM